MLSAEKLAVLSETIKSCRRCQGSGWLGPGPFGEPNCVYCGNSSQNAVPHGSPSLRRCATCKRVWEPKPCHDCSDARKLLEGVTDDR